eukprot:jgi/Hompol1/2227/HPOL_005920-RA
MESTVDLVAKHCQLQVKLFGCVETVLGHTLENRIPSCIDRNPNNWSVECLREKSQLTKCAEENVAELKEIKRRCSVFIESYKSCLNANPDSPAECLAELKELYHCHGAMPQASVPTNLTSIQ